MRLFTAVDISKDVEHALGAMIHRLRPSAKISWTSPEKLHITTKFIGEWPEERIEEMKRALGTVAKTGPIRIAVRGSGWFPNARDPHTLWVGVEAAPELAVLARATEHVVQAIGVPMEERKYSPHLTLARIRHRERLSRLKNAVEAEGAAECGEFEARSFCLYWSKDGEYRKLAEFGID
jgi:RNA 2',3'-cyclic 3'-phosphodiesterase